MQAGMDRMVAGANRLKLAFGAVFGISGALAFRGMIKTIAEFEHSMAAVRAITQASEEDFVKLNETARALGATTVFTASEAARGMELLGMAGFNTNQTIAATPGVLNLAAATMSDMATAADIAANTLRSFGMRAEEAGVVADVLAATTVRSNQNIYDLGNAMVYAAPVARSLGVNIQETAAALGVLADAGMKGSMGGTGLRKVMLSLVNPTKQAGKTLSDVYGIKVEELAAKLQQPGGFLAVMEELAAAQIEVGDAAQIFGVRGVTAFTNLAANIPKLRAMGDELTKIEGEAQRIAEMRMDSLIGDWQKFKSALQEVTLSVGDEGLRGGLRSLVQSMTKALRWMDENWSILGYTISAIWVTVANGIGKAMEVAYVAVVNTTLKIRLAWLKLKEVWVTWVDDMRVLFLEAMGDLLDATRNFLMGFSGALAGMGSKGMVFAGPILDAAAELQTGVAAMKAAADDYRRADRGGAVRAEAERITFDAENRMDAVVAEFEKSAAERERKLAEQLQRVALTGPPQIPDIGPTEALPAIGDAGDEEGVAALALNIAEGRDNFQVVGDKFEALVTRYNNLRAEMQSTDWWSHPIEEAKLMEEEMGAIADEITRRFQTAAVSIKDSFQYGFNQSVEAMGNFSQRVSAVGQEIGDSLDRNMTDGFTAMIMGTKDVKTAFRDMANQIIADLVRVMVQQLIVRSVMRGVSALGGGVSTFHEGGVVGGTPTGFMPADSNLFRGASHFQGGGVAGDEVPIVAHRGEVVFTEEQMAALGQSIGAAGGGQRDKKLEILNVTDPRMVDERLAANPQAVLNVLTRNRSQARRALGM